ncbi:MAG: 6-hydroxymethylpterin diphosphokinase MptE-like protein [Thermoplasmata archaeon]
MNYNEWYQYYKYIKKILNIDENGDRKSTLIISTIVNDDFTDPEIMRDEIQGNEVAVIGDSPYSFDFSQLKDKFIIVADDSARRFIFSDIFPRIIFTDLDTDEWVLEYFNSKNTIFSVHAHGDNIQKLFIVKKLKRRFATTQVKPLYNVFNFGGFTDGDRAVFFSHHMGAKKIFLYGFNFYYPNQEKNKNYNRKIAKLQISKFLIELLIKKYDANIIF